jgi:hypothetical protein
VAHCCLGANGRRLRVWPDLDFVHVIAANRRRGKQVRRTGRSSHRDLQAALTHLGQGLPPHTKNPTGSKTDQIKGYANEAAGKVKQGVDKLSATRGCVQKALRRRQRVMLRRPLAKPRAQSRTWRQVRRQATQKTLKPAFDAFLPKAGTSSVGLHRRSRQRQSSPDLQRNSRPLAPKDRPQ